MGDKWDPLLPIPSGDDESTPHARPASLPGFPLEIYTEVLKELDYFDLKRFAATCKAAKELVDLRAFDDLLFRRGLGTTTFTKGSQVHIHPLFKRLNLLVDKKQDICRLGRSPDMPAVYLDERHPALEETFSNAAPNTVMFYFNFGCSKWYHLVHSEGIKGVSLRQVVQAIYNAWAGRHQVPHGDNRNSIWTADQLLGWKVEAITDNTLAVRAKYRPYGGTLRARSEESWDELHAIGTATA